MRIDYYIIFQVWWVLGDVQAVNIMISYITFKNLTCWTVFCGHVLPPRFFRVNKARNRRVRSSLGSTRTCPTAATCSTPAMLLHWERTDGLNSLHYDTRSCFYLNTLPELLLLQTASPFKHFKIMFLLKMLSWKEYSIKWSENSSTI